jgi:hypothetical protein
MIIPTKLTVAPVMMKTVIADAAASQALTDFFSVKNFALKKLKIPVVSEQSSAQTINKIKPGAAWSSVKPLSEITNIRNNAAPIPTFTKVVVKKIVALIIALSRNFTEKKKNLRLNFQSQVFPTLIKNLLRR